MLHILKCSITVHSQEGLVVQNTTAVQQQQQAGCSTTVQQQAGPRPDSQRYTRNQILPHKPLEPEWPLCLMILMMFDE